MEKENLKEQWELLCDKFSEQFADGDQIDLDGILFLIGVQEIGLKKKGFKKDEKIHLIHVAICRLLEPYGYYKFIGLDEEGWPHYEITRNLPVLKAGEQSILMKQAIVFYAQEQEWI